MDNPIGRMTHVGEESRVSLHWTYLEIAYNQLEIARLAAARFDSVLGQGIALAKHFKPEWTEQRKLHHLETYHASVTFHGQAKSSAIISAIVFSALALEAFINNVARLKLSAFYRDNLDKLDLPAKWVFVTWHAFEKGMPADSDVIERIGKLQKLRNFLVHARPLHWNCAKAMKEAGGDPAAKYRMGVARAEEAVATCIDATNAVSNLDREFEKHDYEYFSKWRLDPQKLVRLSIEFDEYIASLPKE